MPKVPFHASIRGLDHGMEPSCPYGMIQYPHRDQFPWAFHMHSLFLLLIVGRLNLAPPVSTQALWWKLYFVKCVLVGVRYRFVLSRTLNFSENTRFNTIQAHITFEGRVQILNCISKVKFWLPPSLRVKNSGWPCPGSFTQLLAHTSVQMDTLPIPLDDSACFL